MSETMEIGAFANPGTGFPCWREGMTHESPDALFVRREDAEFYVASCDPKEGMEAKDAKIAALQDTLVRALDIMPFQAAERFCRDKTVSTIAEEAYRAQQAREIEKS